MIAGIELKRRVTSAGVFGVILRKLSYRSEPGPVILLKVDKGLEVGPHSAVLPLCLAVSLRVKYGG